jgi:hypothetical protein
MPPMTLNCWSLVLEPLEESHSTPLKLLAQMD